MHFTETWNRSSASIGSADVVDPERGARTVCGARLGDGGLPLLIGPTRCGVSNASL